MNRQLIVALAFAVLAGCGAGSGWSHKALASEKAASTLVGGFSDDDRNLYHAGLQHIFNAHDRIGKYTIAQVIEAEKQRASDRVAAKTAASTQAVTKAEAADIDAGLKIGAQSEVFAQMVRGYSFGGGILTLKIDQDVWDGLGAQEKSMFKKTMWEMWAATRQRHEHASSASVLEVYNLAGDKVDSYY